MRDTMPIILQHVAAVQFTQGERTWILSEGADVRLPCASRIRQVGLCYGGESGVATCGAPSTRSSGGGPREHFRSLFAQAVHGERTYAVMVCCCMLIQGVIVSANRLRRAGAILLGAPIGKIPGDAGPLPAFGYFCRIMSYLGCEVTTCNVLANRVYTFAANASA
jgi:hypothetical protein